MAYKKEQSNSLCQGHFNFLWMEQKKNPHKCMFTDKTFYCIYCFKMYTMMKCLCLNVYFLDFGGPITHQVVRTNWIPRVFIYLFILMFIWMKFFFIVVLKSFCYIYLSWIWSNDRWNSHKTHCAFAAKHFVHARNVAGKTLFLRHDKYDLTIIFQW